MNDLFIIHTTNTNRFVVINLVDKELVFKHNAKWYEDSQGQISARSKIVCKTVTLQRVVLDDWISIAVDHINGLRFDCRKHNLRPATKAQNSFNRKPPKGSSKYKGVHYRGNRNKPWIAKICINQKQINLGSFTNEVEAALAYNNAAIKYFGEFAYLNNINL